MLRLILVALALLASRPARHVVAPLSSPPLVPAPLAAPDRDRDGYPDVLELSGTDRDAFADWFAAVAESQFYGFSPLWAPEDRDCAGLLRFAYRETLRPHDPAWWSQFKFIERPARPPVAAYHYPAPLVSRALFRTAPGPYEADDLETGRMVGRTGAKYLVNYSSVFVSRDVREARRGDLLFFLRPSLGSYHSMVYLGNGKVVYHTGEIAGGGFMQLVSLEALNRLRDPAFRPRPENPSFLGVYRWKILE